MNKNDDLIIRDIERRTLIAINSGFHFKPNDSKEFTRIFEDYKSQITTMKTSIDERGRAWELIGEMMLPSDFSTEKQILSSQEFSSRMESMILLVGKYLND